MPRHRTQAISPDAIEFAPRGYPLRLALRFRPAAQWRQYGLDTGVPVGGSVSAGNDRLSLVGDVARFMVIAPGRYAAAGLDSIRSPGGVLLIGWPAAAMAVLQEIWHLTISLRNVSPLQAPSNARPTGYPSHHVGPPGSPVGAGLAYSECA